MLRREFSTLLNLGFALLGVLAFAGCGGDSEPVSEGRKYEAVDDAPEVAPDPGAGSLTGDNSTNIPPVVSTDSVAPKTPIGNPAEPPSAGAGNNGDNPPANAIAANPAPGENPGKNPGSASPVSDGSAGKTAGQASNGNTANVGGSSARNVPTPPAGGGNLVTMESYLPPKNATPKQLVEHLSKLGRVQPRSRTEQEQLAEAQEVLRGRILSSELLMNSADSSIDQKLLGVQVKIDSLNRLNQLGVPDIIEHARQFTAALKDHPIPELAKRGRLLYLSLSAGTLSNPAKSDPKWVAEEVLDILKDDDLSLDLFQATREASAQLMRMGHQVEGKKCATAVIKRFENTENADIKKFVGRFKEELALADFNFAEKLDAAMTHKSGAAAELVKTVQAAVAAETKGLATLQILAECAQYMEMGGYYKEAGLILDSIEQGYAKDSEPRVQAFVKRTSESARKRLGLIGKPLVVEGETVGGGQLKWSDYQGKIVLIDFWATWCRPCLEEIPNIQANYSKYKSKGFEVIGYNLDEDPKAVASFFSSQKLPWPSVLGKDPAKRGFGIDEFAGSLGIDGIPFVVLVGRDGKVLGIHVRGPELGKRLDALLGGETPAKKPAASE